MLEEDEVRLLRNLSAEGEEKLRSKGWEISKWAVTPLSWAALPASQIISFIAISGKFASTNIHATTRCCIFACCDPTGCHPLIQPAPLFPSQIGHRRPSSASPRSLFPSKDGRHGPSFFFFFFPKLAPNTPYMLSPPIRSLLPLPGIDLPFAFLTRLRTPL